MSTQADVITAAMGVARDAAEGRLDPGELEAAAVEECRQLMGQVIVDGPMWNLQLETARAVLAAGGIPATELREWTAVGETAVTTSQA
ncbi:MAG: flagellar hook-length control protein [Actinomycetia bacterium]|nr:flagellar hook-length control protein [Actinomycetes bacterium]